jgi:hypothetical protein
MDDSCGKSLRRVGTGGTGRLRKPVDFAPDFVNWSNGLEQKEEKRLAGFCRNLLLFKRVEGIDIVTQSSSVGR